MSEPSSNTSQPIDHEPDYRFTLANERTFLAWIRTALALLAGSVAIVQLVPDLGIPEARQGMAALLAAVSIALVAGSALRWHASQKAMRRDAPLPSTLMPWLLAVGVISVGLIVTSLTLMYGVNADG
ncbi:YidH family protein [Salinisphaera hydrothermalis]|uniref:YidH family protein n=1 Tax=Salinisphaera hydrothermalis TaxID=563188 RepID=UPI00334233D3